MESSEIGCISLLKTNILITNCNSQISQDKQDPVEEPFVTFYT